MCTRFTYFCSFLPDIQLLSFGITDEINEQFLGAISGDILTPTGQQRLGVDYFTAPDFQALSVMNELVTSTICKSPPPSRCTITILKCNISVSNILCYSTTSDIKWASLPV